MSYKYLVVATDVIDGMPLDDGKAGMAVPAQGAFPLGYKQVKGDWNPSGLAVREFTTEAAANAWLATADGADLVRRYELVILAQVNA